MTTTHQLMAAFYLCGLLFLLHVDPVNSIRCKTCHYTNPNCNSGNVPDTDCCFENDHCMIMIFNSSTSSQVTTFRGCTTGGRTKCMSIGPNMYCAIYCCTDNCN
ncbi:uncharacterized protein LOC112572665 isoform X2 [Pomacea canaliculata]|uniref:uncharacterized protein LOC112572665 isoform X2 n=1 Tax=Pomacea canaliculata TaxID=400727 RepID=UPI000D73078C|nr:uncharacterized protein LOC112572665 isoform X2 [Pomacea canaliculata]